MHVMTKYKIADSDNLSSQVRGKVCTVVQSYDSGHANGTVTVALEGSPPGETVRICAMYLTPMARKWSPGDRVLVARKSYDGMGWVESMDNALGKQGVVDVVSGSYVRVKLDDAKVSSYWYYDACLDPVEVKSPAAPSTAPQPLRILVRFNNDHEQAGKVALIVGSSATTPTIYSVLTADRRLRYARSYQFKEIASDQFAVGDSVVPLGWGPEKPGHPLWVDSMRAHVEKTFTVASISNGGNLHFGGASYYWHPTWVRHACDLSRARITTGDLVRSLPHATTPHHYRVGRVFDVTDTTATVEFILDSQQSERLTLPMGSLLLWTRLDFWKDDLVGYQPPGQPIAQAARYYKDSDSTGYGWILRDGPSPEEVPLSSLCHYCVTQPHEVAPAGKEETVPASGARTVLARLNALESQDPCKLQEIVAEQEKKLQALEERLRRIEEEMGL